MPEQYQLNPPSWGGLLFSLLPDDSFLTAASHDLITQKPKFSRGNKPPDICSLLPPVLYVCMGNFPFSLQSNGGKMTEKRRPHGKQLLDSNYEGRVDTCRVNKCANFSGDPRPLIGVVVALRHCGEAFKHGRFVVHSVTFSLAPVGSSSFCLSGGPRITDSNNEVRSLGNNLLY